MMSQVLKIEKNKKYFLYNEFQISWLFVYKRLLL